MATSIGSGSRSTRTSSVVAIGQRSATAPIAGRSPPSLSNGGVQALRDPAHLDLHLAEGCDHPLELARRAPSPPGDTIERADRRRERQRHQPLLHAVVEVALDAPPCLVGGRDDASARRAERGLRLAR